MYYKYFSQFSDSIRTEIIIYVKCYGLTKIKKSGHSRAAVHTGHPDRNHVSEYSNISCFIF